MNYFQVSGRVTAKISGFLSQVLGFKNIKSIGIESYGYEINLEMRDGLTAKIECLEPGMESIKWSVKDFKSRAIALTDEDVWQNYYDESKFNSALKAMIKNHDANEGICWLTIDYYLEEFCKN